MIVLWLFYKLFVALFHLFSSLSLSGFHLDLILWIHSNGDCGIIFNALPSCFYDDTPCITLCFHTNYQLNILMVPSNIILMVPTNIILCWQDNSLLAGRTNLVTHNERAVYLHSIVIPSQSNDFITITQIVSKLVFICILTLYSERAAISSSFGYIHFPNVDAGLALMHTRRPQTVYNKLVESILY